MTRQLIDAGANVFMLAVAENVRGKAMNLTELETIYEEK